jgi:hypothetical protein
MIGELLPELRIFKKNVELSKHLFRTLDAWGIDSKFFTDVLVPGGYEIEVYDMEEKKLYKVSAEKFKKFGEYYHFKQEQEDHRTQIFLSRRYWDIRQIPKK